MCYKNKATLGLTVTSVINMHDIIDWLGSQSGLEASLEKMNAYREQYGI